MCCQVVNPLIPDPPLRANGEEADNSWNGSSAGPLLCFGAFVVSHWAYSPLGPVDWSLLGR